MSGFRSHGERVKRPAFKGHRVRAHVEPGYTEREGNYWVVAVSREHYAWVLGTNPWEYRLNREGVYLPFHFKYQYRAASLVKLLNNFFRVYRNADIRKEDA